MVSQHSPHQHIYALNQVATLWGRPRQAWSIIQGRGMVCLHGHSIHVLTAEVCSANKVFSCINDSVKRIPTDSNRQGNQLANLSPASLNV